MADSGSKTPRKTTVEKKPAAGAAKKKKKQGFSAGKVIFWMLAAAALAAISAMGVYIFVILNGNKILQQNIDKLDFSEASIIYDANKQEIGVLKVENRINVEPNEIPPLMKQAFIATEDKRFEDHTGVDFLGIGRALVKDVVARSMVEGGSTITQQLAKNVFLNADKTFFRKATEMSIAVALEQQKTKDEILTMYLNYILFGNQAYGVKAASKVYFNVDKLEDLKLWQIATLAAIPKAPSRYNPLKDAEKSKERRGVVLKLMQEQGYITEAQRAEAAAVDYEPPTKTAGTAGRNQAFVDYVLKEAQTNFNLTEDEVNRGGLKIYTTLDQNAQQIMEQTYANAKFFQKSPDDQIMQSSMVILDNKDGGIVAMVGGRDYMRGGLNRATSAPRQPGSSFKPLIAYAPAIEAGKYTPYSMLKDEKQTYPGGYSPRNYDGVYRGQVTMTEAVKKSINMPAINTLQEIGVSNATKFVEKLGITLDAQDRNLAIALGGLTKGTTPLQMAQAYSAFANAGTLHTAHAITSIVESDGTELQFKDEAKTVMSAKTAWYMTEMMRTVVEPGGTGAAAKFERPVAGKTGSTQLDLKGLEKYNRDLWFVGYTPEWTGAVWMGFDKTDSKHYVSMSSGSAGVIFKEVMQKALAKRPVTQFKKPSGVPDLKEELPPKGVTDLKAEVNPETGFVNLSWSSVGDGITYQAFRKDSTMADYPAEPLFSTQSTSYKDQSAYTPGMTYTYMIVALKPENGAEGAKSNEASVTIPGKTENGKEEPGKEAGETGKEDPGKEGEDGAVPGTDGDGTAQPGTGTKPGAGGTTQPGTTKPGTSKPGTGTTPGTETDGTTGGTEEDAGSAGGSGDTGTSSGTDTGGETGTKTPGSTTTRPSTGTAPVPSGTSGNGKQPAERSTGGQSGSSISVMPDGT
ncbi:PBP1A family penicillin-binding protein [Paenibacillus mucilaginosus]|uniref:Penicillin-binding protein n=1 Tax=Paenibacillus mucilaginosus (strain KNP414) TaxID=1036673 RepID=F8FD41_PAEMK|nr:PBP1A family penicillin-binding protein [Paenibacillus mucilaginosus]AEI41458.1 penicillin-binding protein [Paenibacillus mucilaginosus KNP414]MCG7215501.1 PBP1A family penicillin-binding protein [Paenibacillus mucilaginosus]WDM30471.1 PBP1A family penicillin-binding protein [Paenibacillus mucilaginosus]